MKINKTTNITIDIDFPSLFNDQENLQITFKAENIPVLTIEQTNHCYWKVYYIEQDRIEKRRFVHLRNILDEYIWVVRNKLYKPKVP